MSRPMLKYSVSSIHSPGGDGRYAQASTMDGSKGGRGRASRRARPSVPNCGRFDSNSEKGRKGKDDERQRKIGEKERF